jgi:hypothetical protein
MPLCFLRDIPPELRVVTAQTSTTSFDAQLRLRRLKHPAAKR